MKGAFDGIQDIERDEVFDNKRKKALDLHKELFPPKIKPLDFYIDGKKINQSRSKNVNLKSSSNSNSINDKNIKNDDLSAFIVPVALGALCFTGLAIGGAVIGPALTFGVAVAGVGFGAMLSYSEIKKYSEDNNTNHENKPPISKFKPLDSNAINERPNLYIAF